MPQILWSVELMSRPFGGHNLEVHRGDHGLLDYCTFGVEAANDAQTALVKTACRKIIARRIYQS